MPKQIKSNKNLTKFEGKVFYGKYVDKRILIAEYMERINEVFGKAIAEHPRTAVFRFDLSLSKIFLVDDRYYSSNKSLISRFINSIKAKINAHYHRKFAFCKTVRSTGVRYVWAKERKTSELDHYHVALFLNTDVYNYISPEWKGGNGLTAMLVEAWASALGVELRKAYPLVYISKNKSVHRVDKNSHEFDQQLMEAIKRVSYLAKAHTKNYGDRSNSFGCSIN